VVLEKIHKIGFRQGNIKIICGASAVWRMALAP